jgi:hypothetical protein
MTEPATFSTLIDALRIHPRVAYQGFFADDAVKGLVLAAIPELVPFRGRYHKAIAIVDWDHHLPSRQHTLRVYAYSDVNGYEQGEAAYDERLEQIGARDRYPEFDVPDFADLPSDEAYEATVNPDGAVVTLRLTSPWRREIPPAEGREAVAVARSSAEFGEIIAAALDRPRHLGDLEAVSWTPPCETGHSRWTLDVWYLLAFDGRVGSGRSLLVDMHERKVVTVRDFSVRAG